MAVLQVSGPTVYTCFNRWERVGLAGLANAAGQGRRPILGAADAALVAAATGANRQQFKDVAVMLCQELAKDFSARTLRRFLKILGDLAALPPRPERGAGPGRLR